MPSDDGHKQTDKELKELEKRLTKEYQTAAKEVEEKFNGYMKDFARKDENMRKLVDSGKMSEQDYLNWRRNQLLVGERWKDMYDTLAKDLANVDQIAAGMINETLPSVYALNMNYGTYEVEKGCRIDTGFNLYSRETVENMMKNEPNIIPHLTERQKARIAKDELWNRQKLVSAVTQGVLQGESISKVANRLQSVANMDRNAAIRNARTYTTAAQNKGRMDSYERMDKLGIQVGKKWIATLDDRTRVEHRHLDGMVVPYKDMFEVDGYEIMFPGDPSAEPEMIYNCRCTLVSDIPGIQYNDERYDEKLGDMTYEEWKHAKDKPQKEEENKPTSNIIFSDNVKDETKDLILKLEEQYNTRLGEVSLGANKGAGDVDIAGYTMRLSSEKPDIILHEFAHTLANSSADKYGLTNDKEFWKEIDKVKKEYRKDVQQDTGRWISSYEHSRNDKDEFLAEAFTMAKMKEMGLEIPDKYGNDFTYADRVLEITDKYFGKEVGSEESQEEVKPEKSERQVVQGEDISLTWERRKDEFDFEIEDIINAQGFDGLPKIVSGEEFDKVVKESNFIAQRTYSAVDSETLSAYQDSLYNGKWYVDCSVGGSAHGKGMYSAASYDGELNDEIKQEMKDYIGQNESYTSEDAQYIIEIFTVDPSARFLEIPKGMDDEDYVYGLFSNNVFLQKSTEIGLGEPAKKIIEISHEKSANYNAYLKGEISSDKIWSLNDELNNKMNDIMSEYKELKDIRTEAVQLGNQIKDIGSLTALMGYDGLHTHYGTCGNDTIILNRTKLIFKGEK